MDDQELIRLAVEARTRAYAPYSHFQVGAALLAADGTVYQGCNIENAAYTPSNCAERTAFFKAVSESCQRFRAIAIVGGPEGGSLQLTAPCGVCRQVMMEFCDPETFRILMADERGQQKEYLLKELMPESFSAADLALCTGERMKISHPEPDSLRCASAVAKRVSPAPGDPGGEYEAKSSRQLDFEEKKTKEESAWIKVSGTT